MILSLSLEKPELVSKVIPQLGLAGVTVVCLQGNKQPGQIWSHPGWPQFSSWPRGGEVTCKSDSQLVVGQVRGELEVREPLLQRYYHTVNNFIAKFVKVIIEHIPRQDNERADTLSRLASTKMQSHHWSVIQIHLKQPSVGEAECMAITEVDTWMSLIIQYLKYGTCKPGSEKAIRLQCARYTMIGQDLYQRGYSMPLLKCLTKEQAQYVLQEIRNGACDNHSGARTSGQGYPSRILLADRSRWLCGLCEEVSKMPRVWPTSSFEIEGTPQHDVALAVRHMGNGHHWSFLTR